MASYEELDDLLVVFNETKTKADKFKKEAETYNAKIKDSFESLEIGKEYISKSNGLKATVSISEISTMDEEKLLEVCKLMGVESVIRTKEYVDMDLLENALYRGEISGDKLLAIDKCRKTTVKKTLRVSKCKGEDNE